MSHRHDPSTASNPNASQRPNAMQRTVKPMARLLALAACCGLGSASLAASPVPPRPENLVFAPLTFEPPLAKEFRHTLKDGTVVYLAPSKEFPLINLTLSFKGGAYLDPADLPGLSAMTGAMLRAGGTAAMAPAELDEELDFLASRVRIDAGPTMSSASVNCLASNFDRTFALLMDMLRSPRFDAARLEVQKGVALEGMKQRNDSADAILGREWARLLYGADHFESREMTNSALDKVTPERMKEMQGAIFHPGNMIVAVTGDFEPNEMLAKLEKAFDGWARGPLAADPPAPTAQLTPGLYHASKDIPQGKVLIGMRSIKRDDPDFFPMLVMNEILGGGGFTARIMQSVRSNEGLAYGAGSSFEPGVWYDGEFQASFQSKNPTVALAIKLIDDEFNRMRNEPVTSQELETAKNSFIETFPQNFQSKDGMLRLFVSDEWTKRPADYWTTFRQKVNAVTPEDIQRVAKAHLDPSKMAILVVGNWEPIYQGNDRASMKDFFGGNVTHLPERDPLTLEPVK